MMDYVRNFLKSGTANDGIPLADFAKFTGHGHFYQLKNGEIETIFKQANIKFKAGDGQFCYYLIIENSQKRGRNRSNKENMASESLFRISDRFKLVSQYERRNSEDVMLFEWFYEDNNIYGFEFRSRKRDFMAASNFKELLCKLIFQTKYQIALSENISARDFLSFCRDKRDVILQKGYDEPGYFTPKPDDVTSYVKSTSVKEERMDIENGGCSSNLQTEARIPIVINSEDQNIRLSGSNLCQSEQQSSVYLDTEEKMFIFQRAGSMFQLDERYNYALMQDSVKLCVRFLDSERLQLEIYGPKNSLLYVKLFNADASYVISMEKEFFQWIDSGPDFVRVLAFKPDFPQSEVLAELQVVLAHESSAEKKLQAAEVNSFRMSPSSINCSAVRTNLLERYEEEFQEKVENHEAVNEDTWIFGDMDTAKYCIVVDDEEDEINKEDEIEISSHEGEIQEEVGSQDKDDTDEPAEMLEFEQLFTYHEPEETMGYENNSIAQSKRLDRLFVSRGPIINVFMANDSLKFICSLPELTTLDGDSIHPKKILFYNNGTKMLILNQVLDKKIYSLDLEKGLITNEWVLDGYNSILDIDHFTKNGELSNNNTFIGINNKNIFQFDPNHHDDSSISTKKYTSNPKFSCFCTTKEGYFAVGSITGEIRLFKEIGKNARNLIPGFGDAIIGIDSTRNGSLLAATSEDYIMIHRTAVDNVNGYLTSLKKMNLEPIKLTLPEDLITKYELENVKFTKAKFDNVYNTEENFLITTLGRFLIVWRLEDVFKGLNEPKIHAMKSTILDCYFRDNTDNAIVTILEDETNYLVL